MVLPTDTPNSSALETLVRTIPISIGPVGAGPVAELEARPDFAVPVAARADASRGAWTGLCRPAVQSLTAISVHVGVARESTAIRFPSLCRADWLTVLPHAVRTAATRRRGERCAPRLFHDVSTSHADMDEDIAGIGPRDARTCTYSLTTPRAAWVTKRASAVGQLGADGPHQPNPFGHVVVLEATERMLLVGGQVDHVARGTRASDRCVRR